MPQGRAATAETDILAEKQRIRAAVLARRDAIGAQARVAAARAIAATALPFEDAIGTGPVSGFWPIRSEIDPLPLMRRLSARGAALCLPRITDGQLVFHAFSFGDVLEPAGFGTSVPFRDQPVRLPRFMLVPLAAFDRRGGRIGYGKGYYDEAIARLAAQGALTTVGIAFSVQEVDAVPMQAHDRRLDWILTERELIRPRP